jgi:hypothetical protein
MTDISFAKRFEKLEISAETFSHRDHVQAAFELLHKYPFIEATYKYAGTIQAMATTAGVPEKFNVTVTLAFMGVIAERIEIGEAENFDDFYFQNKDLSGNILGNWYSPDRLASDLSRKIFLMPNL